MFQRLLRSLLIATVALCALLAMTIACFWILSCSTQTGYGLAIGRGFPCLDANVTAGTLEVILHPDGAAFIYPWTMNWPDSTWARRPTWGQWELYRFPSDDGGYIDVPAWFAILLLSAIACAAWVLLRRSRRPSLPGFPVETPEGQPAV